MLWAKEIRQEILRVNPDMGKLMLCFLVDQHACTTCGKLKLYAPTVLNSN